MKYDEFNAMLTEKERGEIDKINSQEVGGYGIDPQYMPAINAIQTSIGNTSSVVAAFRGAMGSTVNDPNYVKALDINKDGSVNAVDFALYGAWLRTDDGK